MEALTKETIAELKKKHGELFKITVEDKSCILRKPTRKELSYASVAGKDDPLKFNEVLLNACWLAGDEELRSDDTLFLSVTSRMGELVEVKKAELEKL